jgi:glucose repression mediator protein
MSESPNSTPAPDGKDRRRKQTKEKDSDTQSVSGSIPGDLPKKERKKRQRRPKEEQPAILSASFKVASFSAKEAQDTSSSSGSGSRSLQPSPTTATPRPPSRVVDEDYDEGVADALVVLSQSHSAPVHSPTLSNGSRHTVTSPRPVISHRGSVSTSGSRPSPPGGASLKRPLSPGIDELDNKRTRMDPIKRGPPSPTGRHTPVPPSRHSPVPLRMQPASRSPESRHHTDAGHPYPPSPPPISVSLPPHPRPIGAGHSSQAPIALPPIATLSPASTAPSPTDDRMAIDRRSPSPPSRGKLSDVMNPVAGSPTARPIASPPRLHEKKDPSPV